MMPTNPEKNSTPPKSDTGNRLVGLKMFKSAKKERQFEFFHFKSIFLTFSLRKVQLTTHQSKGNKNLRLTVKVVCELNV